MCRFLIYRGDPILMCDLITRPKHSLLRQSYLAKERSTGETGNINGDGFGIGWYQTDIDEYPCVFTSVSPAWNNMNLLNIAEKTVSSSFFAHVRAATAGLPVTESNCHPFTCGKYMWMHNGNTEGFPKFKRKLLNTLKDDIFDNLQGTSDSEHAFAVFLNHLPNHKETSDVSDVVSAMRSTVRQLVRWSEEVGAPPSLLNFAVTDGEVVVATRYVNCPTTEPVSLYFSSGQGFGCDPRDNDYKISHKDMEQRVAIISSEPLTTDRVDWLPVPRNNMVVLTKDMNILLVPVDEDITI
eukprot:GFYU01009510.1.p1 GENE.GFYU01009510.1~~GFYU01009510.1.p1  ORF type:complete len:296 (-),score=61.47 GFYU01009510.1:85-972(-)